jgi:hypothetical protein
LQFITGLTQAQIKKLIDSQTIDLTLFNREIAEVTDGNYRYILSINPELEEREKYFLNYHKNKLDQNLEHIRNSWKDRRMKNLDNQKFSIKFDENPYQTDLNLCGKYVICSNVSETLLDKHEVRSVFGHTS